jgi:hypothetical protein
MKRFILLIAIVAITAMAFTACAKKSEAKPQTAAVITAESYAKILNGDLSDFAGTWVNTQGERRTLRADGVFVSGSMDNLNASGFNEYNGSYFWGVYQDRNGFQVTLYPVGVPIKLVNEGMGFGETIESDIAKVRIIGSNVVQNGEVYYREGQAPTAETLAAQRQTTTQNGLPKTMYVTSPDGLRGRTEPSLMGSVVKAFAYGQMIVVSEKSSTPTSIDGILDYWYLTSFSGDDVWLFGGYLSDSLPVEKSSGAYAKILSGDLSDLAGTWVDGRGYSRVMTTNGTFGEGTPNGFRRAESGHYTWSISFASGGGNGVELYPVGVDVNARPGQTDITKVRMLIITSGDSAYNPDEFYYRQGEAASQSLPQEPAELTGEWHSRTIIGSCHGQEHYIFTADGYYRKGDLYQKHDGTWSLVRDAATGKYHLTLQYKQFIDFESGWSPNEFTENSEYETIDPNNIDLLLHGTGWVELTRCYNPGWNAQ